jgi:hypothetical protein
MLLIKFPSRSRPEKLCSVYEKYISFAREPSKIKTIVSLDSDDPTATPELTERLMKIHPQTQVCIGSPLGKIGAVNRDMEHAGEYDILLLASDDMIPEFPGYDSALRDNMEHYFPDTDGVLWFNDGFQKHNLNTLCILGRKYYQRFGYIYHPSYKSLWCDNEFTVVASLLKKQLYFDKVIIRHAHHIITGVGNDLLYQQNDAYFEEDRETFMRRRLINFDL